MTGAEREAARTGRPLSPARACATLALLLQLAACGGGGDSPTTAAAPAPVPAPAPAPAPVPVPVLVPVPAPTPVPAVDPPQVPAGYRLVWADEFDADGLPDAALWDYDTDRNPYGWYNSERQYYARDRAENAVVREGRLVITARKEDLVGASDWGGQHYTSARLVTRGKADWTYGYFEVRAKLPCGAGTWPAIWTLGSGGVWPNDGELDILEQVGSDPTRVFSTVHTLQSGGAGTGGATQVLDACTAFHVYQMTWTAKDIRFAVDGVETYRYANPGTGQATWPFDAPQYLLLNIAIGGTLGGSVDDSAFPVVMEIDHVRVYQAKP